MKEGKKDINGSALIARHKKTNSLKEVGLNLKNQKEKSRGYLLPPVYCMASPFPKP